MELAEDHVLLWRLLLMVLDLQVIFPEMVWTWFVSWLYKQGKSNKIESAKNLTSLLGLCSEWPKDTHRLILRCPLSSREITSCLYSNTSHICLLFLCLFVSFPHFCIKTAKNVAVLSLRWHSCWELLQIRETCYGIRLIYTNSHTTQIHSFKLFPITYNVTQTSTFRKVVV